MFPDFRIALDAGHGGWDLGTVGRQGLLEKDLVLDIVDRLGNLIQKRLGAEVVYTRQDDDYISLEKRTEIANQSQADIFLSVHANYSVSASARGVETYYTNTFSSIHARTPGAALQDVSFANVDIREKVLESHKFAAAVQRLCTALWPREIRASPTAGSRKLLTSYSQEHLCRRFLRKFFRKQSDG